MNDDVDLIPNPGFFRSIWRRYFDASALEAGIRMLESSPAGKHLIALAAKERVAFLLPNRDKIGYKGDDGKVVTIRFGDSVGGGFYNPVGAAIVIQNGWINRSQSVEAYLAEVLGHEMQHAIDDLSGLTTNEVSDGAIQNYHLLSVVEQNEARAKLADYLERMIDSEIRAYARSNAIADGVAYADDGIMTRSERRAILDRTLDSEYEDYETYYEEMLAAFYPGMEFDLYLDDNGEVHINVMPPIP